jgi:AsmA protein
MANMDFAHNQKKPKSGFSRRLLAALAVAFFALVGLIAIVPNLLDQEKLRAQFLSDIGKWTGSDLTSKGAFKLSLFPEFKATLDDVSSINTNSPINISAKSIEIGLSAWPALIGRIESSEIKFIETDVTIRTAAAETLQSLSAKNPLASSIALASKQISADMSAPDLSSIANSKLGKVTFTQSSLTTIAADDTREELSNLNGSLTWPNLQGSALLEAVADWRGETARVDMQVLTPLIFAAGGNSNVSIAIASKPMALSFQGNANLTANFFADGDVSWKTPSMGQFLKWMRFGATAGEAIGEIDLNAKLVTKEGKLFFNDVAMLVSGSAASGSLEIDPVVKPIKSSGTLAFKSVDLAALAASLPIGISGGSNDEMQLLDDLDLDLRLSSEQATLAGYTIANAAGAIRIAKGDASIDLGTGEIAGGTIKGRLELLGPASAKTGHLTVGMSKLHLDQINNLPSGIPIISGPISGKFDISGPYSNLSSLVTTGDGTFNIQLDSGVVRNFNLETMQAAMGKQSVFELPSVYAGMSEAKSFAVQALVKNGVVIISSADAIIDGRRVSINGALPLMSRGIALNGVITDVEPTATTKSLPFFVGGTWSMPLVTTQPAK